MHSKKVNKFVKQTIPGIFNRIKERCSFLCYRYISIPLKVVRLRCKKKIRVVFALANLGAWKTELLYKAMLQHPRFDPVLAIIKSNEENSHAQLLEYFTQKGYDYKLLSENETIIARLNPDIIFYQKSYEGSYYINHRFTTNRKTLLCYIHYAIQSSLHPQGFSWNEPYLKYCWKVFYENELNYKTYKRLSQNETFVGTVTGLPVMDELLTPRDQITDPWKNSPNKKRIIYAPHHTIDPQDWTQFSTFLTTGRIMLELAKKYSDQIQWAFKPHPLLRNKLEKVWGKEATDEYYQAWADAEWSQYENGKYLGLFKYSDAMIHDCASFTMEYIAMNKPVMYLMQSRDVAKNHNELYHRALDLHIHGYTDTEIERFINNVLSGNDPLKSRREEYCRQYLTPPGGQSACTNIINAILGK